MDRGQNRTAAKKYVLAETLGPDGDPLTPKSAPGAAGGPPGKETSTHHLFPSKMVKTADKAGTDDGGAHAQVATISTPGGGTLQAPQLTPGVLAKEAADEGLTSTTVQVGGPTVDTPDAGERCDWPHGEVPDGQARASGPTAGRQAAEGGDGREVGVWTVIHTSNAAATSKPNSPPRITAQHFNKTPTTACGILNRLGNNEEDAADNEIFRKNTLIATTSDPTKEIQETKIWIPEKPTTQ
jgi:hypothetical protein